MHLNSFITRLNTPVSNITLIVFRILFGAVIFAEATGALATGWVTDIFFRSEYSFTIIGLEFLLYLKNEYLYLHYCLIALTGVFIAAGYYYRIALISFQVLWFITYAMQKHHYNNHYYLMILLAFLMTVIPAERRFSMDVRTGRIPEEKYCPQWCIWIFIVQLWIVYFYASIAKIYPGWLEGKPLKIWLSEFPPVAGINPDLFAVFLAYTGIIFDFLVVPLLLLRRTRMIAVGLSFFFHILNSILFQIGTFPYLMLSSLILFFPPQQIESKLTGKNILLPEKNLLSTGNTGKPMLTILVIYFLIQILLPLRHMLYDGDVNWTEEGHRLSWRMMLKSKKANSYFIIKNFNTGTNRIVDPETEGISASQKRVMSKSPDMIWQFSQYLKEKEALKGNHNIGIYCNAEVSLNGGPYRQFIDTTVNLAATEWHPFSSAEWIIRYKEGDY